MADPHVISALREKRAELSGELIATEKRILQLRDDIGSIDRTIRVFDPTSEPHTIRPIPNWPQTLVTPLERFMTMGTLMLGAYWAMDASPI